MSNACESPKLEIHIRPASDEDTPAVMELTRTIWGGHDYVPLVWEDWLKDEKGVLVVGEYAGQVVGLAKLSQIGSSDWWLHGLRTHPQMEGRGVASAIHQYLVHWWEQHGNGFLRLATNRKRLAVHHLCEKTGFHKVGEYGEFIAPALREETDSLPFRKVEPGEVEFAMAFAQSAPSTRLSGGLVDRGWEWCALDRKVIQELIAQGFAWWWKGSERASTSVQEQPNGLVLGWKADFLHSEPEAGQVWLVIGLIACPVEEIENFLVDFRKLASSEGYTHSGWDAPLIESILTVLKRAGYEWYNETWVYLFEKEFAKPEGI